MADEAARTAGKLLGEARRDDGGGGRRQDRLRRRKTVEFGKERNLDVHILRPVFLHEVGAGKRFGKGRRSGHARGGAIGIVGEAVASEPAQFLVHEARRCGQRRRMRIGHRHAPAGAGEYRRPGAPDQPRTDNGNLLRFTHLDTHSQSTLRRNS